MNFYTSKPKITLMQIFFILMIVLFLSLPHTASSMFLSVVFGLLVVITLPSSFSSEPQMRFDTHGIQTANNHNNRFGLISWSDIVEIKISSFKFNRFLAIKVKNPEEYRERVIVNKGALLAPLFQDPSPYISLSFALLTPSLDEALEYIKTNHPDKLAK
jgi:hypothetical protein